VTCATSFTQQTQPTERREHIRDQTRQVQRGQEYIRQRNSA